jgi:hypothetical protein
MAFFFLFEAALPLIITPKLLRMGRGALKKVLQRLGLYIFWMGSGKVVGLPTSKKN